MAHPLTMKCKIMQIWMPLWGSWAIQVVKDWIWMSLLDFQDLVLTTCSVGFKVIWVTKCYNRLCKETQTEGWAWISKVDCNSTTVIYVLHQSNVFMASMSRRTKRPIQALYLLMISKVGLRLVNGDYWLLFMLKRWWKSPENDANRLWPHFCPTTKKSNVVYLRVFCTLRCRDEKSDTRQIWEFCSSRYAIMNISFDGKKTLTWLHIPQRLYFVGQWIPG